MLWLWQVAGLQVGPEHNTHFEGLFKVWIGQLGSILPPGTNIPAAYERGTDQDQDFVQNLAIFLTTFFKVGSLTLPWQPFALCILFADEPTALLPAMLPLGQCYFSIS